MASAFYLLLAFVLLGASALLWIVWSIWREECDDKDARR